MKKMSAILILLVLLCACGAADVLPVEESPIEAETQAAEVDEPKEKPAPEPPIAISREEAQVIEELPRVTLQRALYNDGEEFIFHFDETIHMFKEHTVFDNGDEIERASIWKAEAMVTIENSEGGFIQQFEIVLTLRFAFLEDLPIVATRFFESIDRHIDINFDGYPDLVLNVDEFTRGGVVYHAWVWNPLLGRFDETSLWLTNMYIDEECQEIRSSHGSAIDRLYMIFRFIDGDFVETNRLEILFRSPYFADDYRYGELEYNFIAVENELGRYTLRERHWENGIMVDTWPIITDTEEGLAIMREHLLGKDSIWFPPGREWRHELQW